MPSCLWFQSENWSIINGSTCLLTKKIVFVLITTQLMMSKRTPIANNPRHVPVRIRENQCIDPNPLFSKMSWTQGVKVVTFDSVDLIFFRGGPLKCMRKTILIFQQMPFFLFKSKFSQSVSVYIRWYWIIS